MAILIFALSLVLLVAGLAGGYLSLDLLPTAMGLLYAFAGAVAVALAVVALALGVLIRRIDVLTKLVRQAPAPFTEEPVLGVAAEPVEAALVEPGLVEPGLVEPAELNVDPEPAETEPVPEPRALAEDAEDPINENRAGHIPTLHDIERAIETPKAPPSLVGRYSAGGASYMIFSDGSIEAETTEGAFKFASMGDFKRFLADRSPGKPQSP
jgi:hypothetical protein